MQIGKEYKIESDLNNITLFKKYVTKTGKEYWDAIRFYGTISNAVKGLADLELKATGLKDLEKVAKRQDKIYQLIESLNLDKKEQK